MSAKKTKKQTQKLVEYFKGYYGENHKYYKYHSSIIRAWPEWANDDEMWELYKEARTLRQTIDHIVPLNNSIVCGLHNEFNLQILPKKENELKSNHYWPDMPFENLDLFDKGFKPYQLKLF